MSIIYGDLAKTGKLTVYSVESNGGTISQPVAEWECYFADFGSGPSSIGSLPGGIPAMDIVSTRDTRDGALWKRTFSLRASGLANAGNGGYAVRDRNNPVYRLQTSLKESPITLHPSIATLIKKYDGKKQDDESIVFPKEITKKSSSGLTRESDGKEVSPMWGQTTWLAVSVVFSIQYFIEGSRWADMGKILDRSGTIDKPPRSPETQQRDWLNLGAEAEQSGTMYSVTESWLLSQPGGWFKDLYSREALGRKQEKK